nr:Shedu immune nuclease family protein [Rhizobium leguminosarum]
MLEDDEFREREKVAAKGRLEDAWQAFFERNTWIFGYGLSYMPMSKLDGQTLKSKVAGYNISGRGKEVDGLMKTVAAINSLCFVEIKTSDTDLVRSYRPGVFAPSFELAGAVSQIQVTVQRALEDLTDVFRPTYSETGDSTGETLFQFQPRSFLVIGNLGELASANGANKDKFRSFELFRRSLRWPEVMTFDELYARAKFIVDDAETVKE